MRVAIVSDIHGNLTAFEAVLALEMVAVMVEEPGWEAVANPEESMVTTFAEPCAAKVMGPTWQVMLCAASVKPLE